MGIVVGAKALANWLYKTIAIGCKIAKRLYINKRKKNLMRGLVYGIAAIAAVGIMIAIASTGDPNDDGSPINDGSPGTATAVSVDPVTMAEAGTMTLAVPEMHCSFSCFPRVKKTLENNDAVETVALGPQKVEGTLDNRQVVVQYKAGFELGEALKMLEAEGFTDSQVVQ